MTERGDEQDLWDSPQGGEAVDIEVDRAVADTEPQDANQETDRAEHVEPPD